MAFMEDKLFPRKETGAVRFGFGLLKDTSYLSWEIGLAELGVNAMVCSNFGFLGFCSSWCPGRKLPITT